MRKIAMTVCAAMAAICGVAYADAAAPIEFIPGDAVAKDSSMRVNVPASADAPATVGVQIAAAMGQFGYDSVPLGRTFQGGRYHITWTVAGINADPAPIAIYVGQGANHSQASNALTCGEGVRAAGAQYFFATSPFDTLVIKKMSAAATPSVVLTKIVLTDMNDREYPRPVGYKKVFACPAPWGLRNKAIEAKVSDIGSLGEVEAWMDRRSFAAELYSRKDDLARAVRMLKLNVSTAAVDAEFAKVNDTLDVAQLKKAEAALDALQKELNVAVGGEICPELGTDVFTWVKSWTLTGSDSEYEYGEPTPMLASYACGVAIELAKFGEPMDMTSSWTTNVYTSPTMTVTYSIMTPMAAIDLKQNSMMATIRGLTLQSQHLAEGWFVLASSGHLYLWVTSQPIASLKCDGETMTISFASPASLGYARISKKVEKRLPEIAAFYRGVLGHQPVQCVQVQKGQHVEQTFEYVDRPIVPKVAEVKMAPLPHMLWLSMQPTSALHAKLNGSPRRSADGLIHVPDVDRFSYEMPERTYVNSPGYNTWLNQATRSTYADLRAKGCKTIRLVCRNDGGGWPALSMDEKKRLLQQNLQWAREVGGLKVGVDMHGEWFPEGMSGEKGFGDPKVLKEFIARWKLILQWCEPYRDVIGWYDLMNEPLIFHEHGPVTNFAAFMRPAVKALRPLAGDTPFLVEGINMANPVGFDYWEKLGDANIILGYHDYWPHMFTHQRVVEPGDMAMPATFYPSFMPMISWVSPSWRNDSKSFYYWDRWKCNSISLPVYRKVIEMNPRIDCGEYGVVGYTMYTSQLSSRLWIRHAMQRFRHLGVNHTVWGGEGGYTTSIEQANDELETFWKNN